MRNKISDVLERFIFILAAIVCHATDFIVSGRASKCFIVNGFSNGGFDQITSCQKDGARSFHDNAFVAHDWQVGASSDATSHHGSNLRNPCGGQFGIVPEHASKVFLVRKDLILHWEIYACTVDKVDDGQPVFEGNFLSAKVFLPVIGNHAPAFTVASLATTMHGLP